MLLWSPCRSSRTLWMDVFVMLIATRHDVRHKTLAAPRKSISSFKRLMMVVSRYLKVMILMNGVALFGHEVVGFSLNANPRFLSIRPFNSRVSVLAAKKIKKPRAGKQKTEKSAKKVKLVNPQANSKRSKSASAPPWQVLSSNEAKKNVEKEKERRKLAQQGVQSVDDSAEPQAISKNFLSDVDQRLVKWSRFNPVTAPAGMQFIGS